MNSLTRKLVLAVITVVLTVVALGSTTFAWFTLSNRAVIENFDVSVTTDVGIEFAIGAEAEPLSNLTFRTTLTSADILAYIEDTYGPTFAFSHVTSPDGENFYELGGNGTTAGYLSLPIHFRSNSSNLINWYSVDLFTTDSSYTTATTFVDSKGVTRNSGSSFTVNTADAIRISMIGDSIIAYENPSSATNTVLGLLANADLTTANGAVDFYQAVTSLDPAGVADVSVVETETAIANDFILTLAADPLNDYGQAFHGTLRINIWFEGWDAEAYNALLGRAVTIGFEFRAA